MTLFSLNKSHWYSGTPTWCPMRLTIFRLGYDAHVYPTRKMMKKTLLTYTIILHSSIQKSTPTALIGFNTPVIVNGHLSSSLFTLIGQQHDKTVELFNFICEKGNIYKTCRLLHAYIVLWALRSWCSKLFAWHLYSQYSPFTTSMTTWYSNWYDWTMTTFHILTDSRNQQLRQANSLIWKVDYFTSRGPYLVVKLSGHCWKSLEGMGIVRLLVM